MKTKCNKLKRRATKAIEGKCHKYQSKKELVLNQMAPHIFY